MRRLLPLGFLLLAACGAPLATGTHGPSASPPGAGATVTASPREVLFAVLEARQSPAQMGPEPGVRDAHDRVAIVGLDGVARAKADFTPRQDPVVGNAAPLLQPEARVAGGRVFFADGAGVVRELTRTGVHSVATFSIKSQQEISFAVSPDGAHLEASRYTFPPVNPSPSNPGQTFLTNTYRYELLAADAGAGTRALLTTNGGYEVTQQPDAVGWDASSVIATKDTEFGTQSGIGGRTLFGHAVRLDAGGHPGPVLGGPACSVLSVSGDVILCTDDPQVNHSVRRADGTMIWAPPTRPQGSTYSHVVLSPDHSRIAYAGGVAGQDGSTVALPGTFNPQGWLDSQTLIGITGVNNGQEMAVLHLANPTQIDDLGFEGEFIGVLP